jgi:hypothetical protein
MATVYNNRMIINQRGGSIDIDNTTDKEKIKVSQRSGSNITLNNVVNSELATNNKQTMVVNDSFETVSKNKNVFVAKDNVTRTGENTYNLKGFISKEQIDAYKEWKEAYRPVAELNSQFKIKRGGFAVPNGPSTGIQGRMSANPVIGSKIVSLESEFTGFSAIPRRSSRLDEVFDYSVVRDASKEVVGAQERSVSGADMSSAGEGESNASTEGGSFAINVSDSQIGEKIVELQPQLAAIEQKMGDGGDETEFVKRHKFEQVGAEFNDYPSARIDPVGRSQPSEMLVSTNGAFKNHTGVPHVEEIDNSSNFPCGNDDKVVGNRYSRTVGSGGIQLKTTGTTELGGTVLKAGFNRVHINASHGVHIASEEFLDLQSLKSITLRTRKQVYVESSLGVRGNLVVGGGTYLEGELYCHHITAPLEVHQTQDTIVYGKFNTLTDRSLIIGEYFADGWRPVYAVARPDLIVNTAHSHHHNGIPMRLTGTNANVRNLAAKEGINNPSIKTVSQPRVHSKKDPVGDS